MSQVQVITIEKAKIIINEMSVANAWVIPLFANTAVPEEEKN